MVKYQLFARLSAAALLVLPSSLSALPIEFRDVDVPALTGSERTMGSGTDPRANYFSDGSIIGSFTAFAGEKSILIVVHSTDNRATWTQIGTVVQDPVATTDIDNPYPFQLPSRRIPLAFRNHSRENGVYTFFRITICYSNDNGATWAYLSQPASDPGPTNGNWEPFFVWMRMVPRCNYTIRAKTQPPTKTA